MQQTSVATLTAHLLHDLGTSPRLEIIEVLRSGPRHVEDIVRLTGLTQPHASRNLKHLRRAGLLHAERDGRFVVYSLTDPRVITLVEMAEKVALSLAPRRMTGEPEGR